MIQTFRDAWKIPEIRKKLLFTLLMLVVFRFGSHIPVPFMNREAIAQIFNQSQGGILSFLDLMSGGNFGHFSIFATSIYPYITASIVLQLLTIAIPSLEALSKEGETGRKKIAQYTRYLAVALAAVQAIGYTYGFYRQAVNTSNMFQDFVIIASVVAGSTFLIWIGEMITERGIGNGISLLIFAGIVARFPADIWASIRMASAGMTSWAWVAVFLILAVAIVVFVVLLNEGQRRIPVQYAKRVVGRKMYGGQSTHIPIKVLMSGVMPIIFAQTIMSIPSIFVMFQGRESDAAKFLTKWFTPAGNVGIFVYSIFMVLLIVFFTFFYTAIQFNTVEYSKNLQQNGGFIPGIRPGKSTSDYLQRTVNRLVFPGAIALAILSVLPTILEKVTGMNFSFGGTSLIIVVGVILETARVLEQQLMMRHYKGFLK
ncbi:preprotein translocase subunit SecY [Aedoeadaptatus ivorii]|uniref:Protein translocase subunit SecY n=1 Tax=Aedoeadaptatus ivorii TaxID=54006 RepID=A0A3S5C2R0_9FIRM|nr:preprotein translocase subunit SecY [Peptoniphilus ivorii]MDQ0508842.1 preprotein translocase subunit SecY [Peptoniphilus ivorii]VEJ36038.1 preprotein translocase subunit SecY [Peptoniphilus ivorii]